MIRDSFQRIMPEYLTIRRVLFKDKTRAGGKSIDNGRFSKGGENGEGSRAQF